MAFNIEDLKTDLGTNPQLAAQVFEVIKSSEVVANHTKAISEQYFNENKGKAHGEIYALFDKVFEEAGFKKADGIKSTEHAGAIVKQLVEANKQIETQKASGKGGEELEKLTAKFAKEKTDYETLYKSKLEELENKLKTEQVNNRTTLRLTKLSEAFGKLSLNPAIPKEAITAFAQVKMQELAANAEGDGDNIIWKKADESEYKNANHLNASLEEVMAQVFKDFIKEQQGGGGSNPAQVETKLEGTVLTLQNPHLITTKTKFAEAFMAATQAQGITSSHKDYKTILQDAKKRYNVDALPEQ